MINDILELLGLIFIVVPVLLAVLVSIFSGIREIMFK
jgi:hypothetical protein